MYLVKNRVTKEKYVILYSNRTVHYFNPINAYVIISYIPFFNEEYVVIKDISENIKISV